MTCDNIDDIERQVRDVLAENSGEAAWRILLERVLTRDVPFARHLDAFERCYGADAFTRASSAWFPDDQVVREANVTEFAAQHGFSDYAELHRWSVEYPAQYWADAIARLGVVFRRPYCRMLNLTSPTSASWLEGAKLNVVETCLNSDADSPALVTPDDEGGTRVVSFGELRRLTARVANGLVEAGVRPGDRVGIVMPTSVNTVAIYLGIIAAGAAVVGMPESFSTEEIATRLRIAGASLVFTQDIVQPGTKGVPLCNRVTAADAPPAIIVATSGTLNAALRPEDRDYRLFLSDNDKLVTVDCDAGAPVNILFSSGTTGEPKAIPWDHTTAIKCAADAHFHQDVHAGDVLCWPTSLGWMMGPWILFGALMNHSALAIYDHSATLTGFGKFVQDAGVTMLGLVPSLVRSWRHSGKMEQYDWSAVKVFSSSGECSNGPDTLYLMYLANYRPVIEYCGGTEIGGAYITSVVVRPSVPAAFNTPNLSIDFKMFNERGQVVDAGEAFLRGPSIGFSTRLLNRDHDKLYYADTPRDRDGMPLRRHGDEIVTLPGAYYRVIGRSDDTMNLSGIKVGCAEIERVVGEVDGVGEAAAIAVPEPGGGPSRLVVFVAAEPGVQFTAREIKPKIQRKIKEKLSSLFHLDEVRVVDSLPRTASNKVMRRELRAMLGQN